jgi:putative redox protein
MLHLPSYQSKNQFMETSHLTYIADLRIKSRHLFSGQEIITDAPKDNKGKGEAFSPTDLVANSLAACMITIMGIAAREHQFDIDNTEALVTKVMSTNPRRIAEIIIEIHFPPNNYSDKQKRILEFCVKTCPVALSLHPDIKQTVNLHY